MIKLNSLLASAFYSSSSQVFSKLIGLLSTLIVARILTPNDFGLIAIVSIVIFLFDQLANVGSEQYIIQKSEVSDNDLNSAWTLNLLLKSALCLALIISAKYIALFFNKIELTLAFQVSSFLLLINSLNNPYFFVLKRDLAYQKVFVVSIIQRLISFVVLISMAITLESYWAFIIANLVSSSAGLALTYLVRPYKARLCFVGFREQWLFSKWILSKGFVGYIRSQIDTLFVSKFFSVNIIGNYSMAREIAMLPAMSIIAPALEPLVAHFKDYKSDSVQLGEKITQSFTIVSCIAVPITLFVYQYAESIITLLLGKQWEVAGGYLEIMSLLFFYYVFLLIIENVLLALGRAKTLFFYDGVSLVLITIMMGIAIFINADITALIWVRALTGLFLVMSMFVYLKKVVQINLIHLLYIFSITAVCGLVSIWVTTFMLASISWGSFDIIVTGLFFVSLYMALIYIVTIVLNSEHFRFLKTRHLD